MGERSAPAYSHRPNCLRDNGGSRRSKNSLLAAGEGDRYFLGTGTYSRVRKPDFREITLFEIEVLGALLRNDPPLQSGPIKIAPGDHRRNLTVQGVPLNHLVGKRFRVGAAVLFGGRLNFPSKYLENLVGLPLYLPLYNRSGLNCVIEKAGVIRSGDPIEPLDTF